MKLKHSSVVLVGLRFHARHGVMAQERLTGGDFLVTLRVHYNISRAMESDKIGHALNYAELYRVVGGEMRQPSRLLEHAAGRIGKKVLDTFAEAEAVEVALTKCNPPMGADCAGATVELLLER